MSNNLNLTQVSTNQTNPEVPVNDKGGELDAALTETLTINMTNSVTVTSAQYTRCIRINVTTTGTSKVLTLQAIKRLLYINNAGTSSISVTLGTTTIAVAAGSGGFFYTDGTTNGLVQLASSGGGGGGGTGTLEPYDIAAFMPTTPIASQVVMRYNVVRPFTWLATLPGSIFNAATAATASTVFTIAKNGSSIGTLTWAAAGTVPTVSFASDVTFASADVITVTAPVTPDTTLAGISLGFFGTKAQSTAMVANDLSVFIPGKPGANATVVRLNVVRDFQLPASLTGSKFSVGVNPTATAVFTINKNGSSIGSLSVATSGTVTVTFASTVLFVATDIITITAPSSQDATMADVSLNFLGNR